MTPEQMQQRTRQFALRALRLGSSLRPGRVGDAIGRQLVRSGTSVGANYRAACRARSTADFVAKPGIVEEELDESLYWMELILDVGIMAEDKLSALMDECRELLAIVVASINTARKGPRKRKTPAERE